MIDTSEAEQQFREVLENPPVVKDGTQLKLKIECEWIEKTEEEGKENEDYLY